MNTDLQRFISGGYFLTKRVSRPPFLTNLAPDPLISLSHCFADIAPEAWADKSYNYEDEERAAEARKFTIPAAAVPALVEDFTRAVEPRHISDMFPTLAIAQEFYRNCTDRTTIALVGIGLEPSLLESVFAQRNDDVNQGYWLIDRLDMKQPLESGGRILGYEPLGFEISLTDTDLANKRRKLVLTPVFDR
jgi:hypothetical protein